MEKIGIAIVGASHRSTMLPVFLKKYPNQGYVTGIYDKISSKSEHLAEKFSLDGAAIYESLEDMVADDKVKAVFIGTSDSQHAGPAIAALQAGKHVYCEKPMAITLENCDAIIAAAQASQSVFYLGMNLRHGPVHETLHKIVTDGQLGKVLTIEANEYYEGGRSYFRRWNRLRELGGGLWITKACHDFDLLNWISGGKPVRVFATSSLSYYKPNPQAGPNCRQCPIKKQCPDYYDVETPETPMQDKLLALHEQATGQPRDLCLYNSDKDTFDNGIAVVDYDNDIRATYTVNVVSARNTRQMRIMGTLGSAEGDMEEGKVTVWRRYSTDKTVHDLSERMKAGHGGSDDQILMDFLRCCRTLDKPRSSWAEGRLSVQVGLAARESADTGKPVILK